MKMDDQKELPEKIVKGIKWDRSDLASAVAIIISMAALFIGLYEAKIMKEQQVLMVDQQQASVWPYLEKDLKISYSDEGSLSLSLENKGVGPAILKEAKLIIQETEITSYDELFTLIFHYIDQDKIINMNFKVTPDMFKVLKPGEKLELFNIQLAPSDDQTTILSKIIPELRMVYCSIYNECWNEQNEKI